MPALPTAAQTIKVLLQYAMPGVATILNRLFFSGTGSTTNAAMNTWCTNVSTAWSTNFKTQIVPGCALVAVTASDLTLPTSPVGAWAGNIPGTAVGTAADPATSFIVKNHVAVKYRGGHSRTYIPGLPVVDQASAGSNQWTGATAAAVLTAWQAFLTAISGANGPAGYTGLAQSYVPYYKGSTGQLVGVAPNVHGKTTKTVLASTAPVLIAGYTYNPTMGDQRRRHHQSQ